MTLAPIYHHILEGMGWRCVLSLCLSLFLYIKSNGLNSCLQLYLALKICIKKMLYHYHHILPSDEHDNL